MKITHLAEDVPTATVPWEFTVDNYCGYCGATWRIDADDRRAPWWRFWPIAKPRGEVLGPGTVNRTMYYVRHYTAEMMGAGGGGTALVSRCPGCGEYCVTWKRATA